MNARIFLSAALIFVSLASLLPAPAAATLPCTPGADLCDNGGSTGLHAGIFPLVVVECNRQNGDGSGYVNAGSSLGAQVHPPVQSLGLVCHDVAVLL